MTLHDRLKVSGTPTPIVGECAHCRLPIYENEPSERIPDWPWNNRDLYHSGCAWRVQVRYHQEQLAVATQRLRVLGCIIKLEIHTPVS